MRILFTFVSKTCSGKISELFYFLSIESYITLMGNSSGKQMQFNLTYSVIEFINYP